MTEDLGQRVSDYGGRAVEAARKVVAELSVILQRFGDAGVVVGGSFPELAFPGAGTRHVGTLDVDLLLDPEKLPAARGDELSAILGAHGYRRTEPPFKIVKAVHPDEGEPVTVEVDFLIPSGARPLRVGDGARAIRPAPAAGGWLALRAAHVVAIGASDAGNPVVRVQTRIPRPGAWLVMKAHALASRNKEKDAYDIVYRLRELAQAASAIARELGPHRDEPDVREAIEILRSRFRSAGDSGPEAFSRFLDPGDPDERLFLGRDAYERVQSLLRALQRDQDRHR